MAVLGQLLFHEGWGLANGSAWPARWTASGAGSTVDVQSGAGRVVLAGVTGGYAEHGGATAGRQLTTPDFELTADVTFSSVTAESYGAITVGDTHNVGGAPLNGLELSMQPAAATLVLSRFDAGAQTDLVFGSFTFAAATVHRVRYRREGPFAAARIWTPSTTVEPTTWTVSVLEWRHRGAGHGAVMCGLFGGNVAAATALTVDNLRVWELAHGRPRRAGVR